MKPRVAIVLTAGLLLIAWTSAWPQEETGEANRRYEVPTGGTAELLKFVDGLGRFQPTTTQADFEHRAKFRPALQAAAERIFALEKDRSSEACQAAEYIVLANRARWLAQTDAGQQRQTVADVKAYLKRKLRTENAPQAIRLAISTGQTLLAAGRPDLAIDLAEGLPGELRKSNDPELRNLADMVDRIIRSVAPSRALIRPEALTSRRLPKGRLTPLDFQAKANRKTQDLSPSSGFEGNGLAELGLGDKTLDGVRFRIAAKLIQLAGGQEFAVPKTVEGIPVQRAVQRLYVLHATQWNAGEGTVVGRYTFHYEDGSMASMPIVVGQDVRDWHDSDLDHLGKPVSRGRVVWTGSNRDSGRYGALLRLYLGTWENRRPGKKVTHIDFSSTSGEAAPFCVAMTVEEPDAGPGRTR